MILVLDADKSTSVIKGQRNDLLIREVNADYSGWEFREGEQQKVRSVGMDHHVKFYLDLFFYRSIVTLQDSVLGIEFDEEKVFMNDNAKERGLHTVVLDSISGLGEAVRLGIVDESRFSQMTRDLWGKYAHRIGKLMGIVRDLPVRFIVTCHIDINEDAVGTMVEMPGIKGGQKTDALRWFDVIIYTVVDEDGNYLWNVKPSDERPFIRSRVAIPEWEGKEYVTPDFGPIYRAYGKSIFKALIIGHSGTGKTSSLLTIPTSKSKIDVKQQEPVQQKAIAPAAEKAADEPTGADEDDGFIS